MDFPVLRQVLTDYFGEEAEISSPEDETEAWQSIVRDCRDGFYPGLAQEIRVLLKSPDEVVQGLIESCAPAWDYEGATDARHSLEVFCAYVETYAE